MADPRLAHLAVMVSTIRTSLGLSVGLAAATTGIARATWEAIEATEHDPDYLQVLAMARTLTVPAAVLFDAPPEH